MGKPRSSPKLKPQKKVYTSPPGSPQSRREESLTGWEVKCKIECKVQCKVDGAKTKVDSQPKRANMTLGKTETKPWGDLTVEFEIDATTHPVKGDFIGMYKDHDCDCGTYCHLFIAMLRPNEIMTVVTRLVL